MNTTKEAVLKELRTLASVLLGTLLVSVAIAFFIDPLKFYTGGVSGLSQLIVNIVEAATDGAVKINLGILLYGFQIPILVFGWIKLSRRFIIYTIISVTLTSLFLALPIGYAVLEDDLLASSIFGGTLLGLGNGLLLHAGASSGGTTIPFQYVSIRTGKSVGFLQIVFNAIIVGIAGFRFGFPIAIYTIISQMISSIVIDRIHTGYNFMKLEIVTDAGADVIAALVHQVPHGITSLDAVGMYSLQAKKMLYTVVSVHEVPKYVAIIRSVDPKAFIVMTGVSGVRGKFTKKIIGRN
jgi:uncharacterized membrane-anchored protein YitT (DUF2179 family)